jgi:V/A-type H+/Na+-transporting ATPase subunit E
VATSSQNAPEILREEILADARRRSDDIIHRAKQESEALLAKATVEADKLRKERLDQARAEAARQKELMLATVPVEAGRLRGARMEEVLESVHDEVRRRLTAREAFDYRESVAVLATEAIKQMQGSAFIVKLSAADRAAFGDELARIIAGRVGQSLNLTVSEDAALKESGAIIVDAEGRQLWDNRLLARLERLWPELRQQIAVQTALVTESKPAGGGA